MRKPFLTAIFCLLTCCAFAQNFTITNNRQNIVYVGLSNRLLYSVDNHNCQSVILRTENGNLKKNEDCSYDLTVGKAGEVLIEVAVKEKGKTKVIGTYPFRAKDIPNPVARVAGKKSGTIAKNLLRAQIGLSAQFEDMDICGSFRVTSFYMIVIRQNKTVFGHPNSGFKFNDRIQYFMPELQTGDKVFFVDIHCVNISKMDLQLSPLEFTIE